MAGVQLDPGQWEGYQWAAPLWSERGLTGLLLLGEKSDGGFYSLEEIEIARASGERLADLQASAEMARRLMALQRQRLAESLVLDRRARRVLHDDVLPRLHAALLELNSHARALPGEGQEPIQLLAEAHRRVSDLLLDLPTAAAPEIRQQGLIHALRKITEEELAASFDQADWKISAEAERRVALLPPLAAEVVYYAAREALRNAARHARPAGDHRQLHLSISLDWCDGLELRIEDNGVGLAFSGPGSSGSGSGLALHSTMMAVINGSLALESAPGEYTRVVLRVPETPG
jgi:signal transduction histidine kinase